MIRLYGRQPPPVFMDCVPAPHIIGDPCRPRWVVQCKCGHWFYYNTSLWSNKRDEFAAFMALFGLAHVIATCHPELDSDVIKLGMGWGPKDLDKR